MSMTPFGRPVVPGRVHQPMVSSAPTGARGRRDRIRVARSAKRSQPATGLRRDADPHDVAAVEPVHRVVRELEQRLVAHEDARLGVLQDEPELRCGEAPVDRHRDRAQVVRREDRRQELVAVVREQADDVTRADATLLRARPPARQPSSTIPW